METRPVSTTDLSPQISTPANTPANDEADARMTGRMADLVTQIVFFNNRVSISREGEESLVRLDDHAMSLLADVEAISVLPITDDLERLRVDQLAAAIRSKRDEYEAQYRGLKNPVVKLCHFFDGAWRKVKTALEGGINTCDLKIIIYDQLKREEAERARRRLQQIADAEAARARQRIIAETERAIASARGLEKRTLREELSELKSAEPVASPVSQPPPAPEEAGHHTRRYWRAEVTDIRLLRAAVVAGETPGESVEPAMSYLNAQARALGRADGTNAMNEPGLKGKMPFPGVRAVPDDRRVRA